MSLTAAVLLKSPSISIMPFDSQARWGVPDIKPIVTTKPITSVPTRWGVPDIKPIVTTKPITSVPTHEDILRISEEVVRADPMIRTASEVQAAAQEQAAKAALEPIVVAEGVIIAKAPPPVEVIPVKLKGYQRQYAHPLLKYVKG